MGSQDQMTQQVKGGLGTTAVAPSETLKPKTSTVICAATQDVKEPFASVLESFACLRFLLDSKKG